MSPELNPIENLWRELKSAIAKRTPAKLKGPEHTAVEEQQKPPADRCL